MATAMCWNFIVGKKPRAHILNIASGLALLLCNIKLIHNLFTGHFGK